VSTTRFIVRFTSGDNPLYADFLQRTTLYTIGLGDTIKVPDLIIWFQITISSEIFAILEDK